MPPYPKASHVIHVHTCAIHLTGLCCVAVLAYPVCLHHSQIEALQHRLELLKAEKHKLFQQLKTVLHEEDEKKRQKEQEQKHMYVHTRNVHVHVGV